MATHGCTDQFKVKWVIIFNRKVIKSPELLDLINIIFKFSLSAHQYDLLFYSLDLTVLSLLTVGTITTKAFHRNSNSNKKIYNRCFLYYYRGTLSSFFNFMWFLNLF